MALSYPASDHRDARDRIASIRHRHRAQRHAFACREFFRRTLELAAGGKDVAPARRAHRRRIARIEDVFGELLDLLPVGAFVIATGPRIERTEIDLGRDALERSAEHT